MEIKVAIPSRGKTATLEVKSAHSVNSVVEVLCEELGLGNKGRWNLACDGKTIDDSKTLGELNLHDSYRIEMVEVEVGAAFVKTGHNRFWREWLNEPVGGKARPEAQRLEPSHKQSFREWLNQPVGAKKPSKNTRISQPRESSRTKQSWKEWLNQPVRGKKPSLRKKKGKKPSVRRKKELSEFSPSPANKFCHECGARILLGSRFCVECGSELGSQTARAVVGGPA